jgi:hypothetical protein
MVVPKYSVFDFVDGIMEGWAALPARGHGDGGSGDGVYWLEAEWAASYARQKIYCWAEAGGASGGGAETHDVRFLLL